MRSTRAQRGFTLIEAMMASVLLAFCVVGLCSALVAATQSQAASGHSFTATEAAHAGVENLATQHLSHLSSASGGQTTEPLDVETLGTADSGILADGSLTYITRDSAQNARDIAIITVTARTPTGQTVKLQRLVTRAENSK